MLSRPSTLAGLIRQSAALRSISRHPAVIGPVLGIPGSSCLSSTPSGLSPLNYPEFAAFNFRREPDACTSQFLPHQHWPSGRRVGPRAETLLDTMVRPRTPPGPGALRVHGLSADVLCQSSPFKEVHRSLADLLTGRFVIAYNAAFDRHALDNTCRISGVSRISCTWDCAMARYEQWRGFRASLDTACEVESIVVETRRHRALPDAQLVWRLIRRMAGYSA